MNQVHLSALVKTCSIEGADKIQSGQVQCKYKQEKNEDCVTRFSNNKFACATKSVTDKSDVKAGHF